MQGLIITFIVMLSVVFVTELTLIIIKSVNEHSKIIHETNVISTDRKGNLLRLVSTRHGMKWIKSQKRENDISCVWTKI